MKKSLIYLDNAATTYPKPISVLNEMESLMKYKGGNPGRGSYSLSFDAAEAVFGCRSQIVHLFNGSSPENVVFTYNTTYALNIAIKSVINEHNNVLISNFEHNSVLRPIYSLCSGRSCSFTMFDAYHNETSEILNRVKNGITPKTSAIVVTHLSNVCGVTLPLKELGKICRENGLFFIVDAAQSAGILEIDLNEWCIDALCVPSHKGLYGPQGCGFILFSDKFINTKLTRTLIEGGSGINSLEKEMPAVLPERFEPGTLGVPAISGLSAGIEFVRSRGVSNIRSHENRLKSTFTEMLCSEPELLTVYAKEFTQGSTVLFNAKNIPSEDLARRLAEKNICVRGGFHCSPLAHKRLGTGENGAVRASFSVFNTPKEAVIAAEEIISLAKSEYKSTK